MFGSHMYRSDQAGEVARLLAEGKIVMEQEDLEITTLPRLAGIQQKMLDGTTGKTNGGARGGGGLPRPPRGGGGARPRAEGGGKSVRRGSGRDGVPRQARRGDRRSCREEHFRLHGAREPLPSRDRRRRRVRLGGRKRAGDERPLPDRDGKNEPGAAGGHAGRHPRVRRSATVASPSGGGER